MGWASVGETHRAGILCCPAVSYRERAAPAAAAEVVHKVVHALAPSKTAGGVRDANRP